MVTPLALATATIALWSSGLTRVVTSLRGPTDGLPLLPFAAPAISNPPNYRRVINRAQSSRLQRAGDGISARIYFGDRLDRRQIGQADCDIAVLVCRKTTKASTMLR